MRFLRVFLVVGAALLPAACMPATRACTEIGCSDLLRIAFDRTVPANYSVSFTVGNNEGHADCSSGVANLQGTFQAFVECTATGVTLHSAPPSVRVSVTSNGGEFSGAADLTPSYATLQPNGEGCPPICRQGQASLNLSSTDGGVPDGG